MASEIKGLKELVEPGHASRSALGSGISNFKLCCKPFRTIPSVVRDK